MNAGWKELTTKLQTEIEFMENSLTNVHQQIDEIAKNLEECKSNHGATAVVVRDLTRN